MKRTRFLIALLAPLLTFAAQAALAQVVPDDSLGQERSQVRVDSETRRGIEGGARRNDAVFHSFERFNIGDLESVYFDNPAGVESIFARITGRDGSRIRGTLGVSGGADLILINPNGIWFGPNARLDLTGSFLASTASAVNFSDFRFSTATPAAVPLLTNTVPIGLGFAETPAAAITLRGVGHSLDVSEPNPTAPIAPLIGAGQDPAGLRVSSGQQLALIGGDVLFKGGVATAPSGRVILGAVASGQVNWNAQGRWQFNYPDQLSTIRLDRFSLVDASGLVAGDIRLTGQTIQVRNGSYALIQNQGDQASGRIAVSADTLTIVGRESNQEDLGQVILGRSALVTETFSGSGGEIQLEADRIRFLNAGGALTATYGTGAGGNISIRSGDIDVIGVSPFGGTVIGASLLQTANTNVGPSGNLSIDTETLDVDGGGVIATSMFFSGDPDQFSGPRGGTIRITADTITLTGADPASLSSTITSSTFGNWDAGNVLIRTESLNLIDGGTLGSASFNIGSSGVVRIDASSIVLSDPTYPTETIRLLSDGETVAQFYQAGNQLPSSIYATATLAAGGLSDIVNIPPELRGESGSILINTNQLTVNSGIISVANLGTGSSGNLVISADSIDITGNGFLSATSTGGQDGNITIRNDSLRLQDQGLITAEAIDSSDGGNINIDTDAFALLDNARLSASAQEGRGGQITITSDGVFQSPESAIEATSELGPEFDGSITIDTGIFTFSQSSLFPQVAPQLPDLSPVCQSQSQTDQSEFTVTGRGGFPASLETVLNSSSGWVPDHITPASSSNSSDAEVIEAQGWKRNEDGATLRLVATPMRQPTNVPTQHNSSCHSVEAAP